MTFDIGAGRQRFFRKAVWNIAEERLDRRYRIGQITLSSRKPAQRCAKLGLRYQQIALCLNTGLNQSLNLFRFGSRRCDMLLLYINRTSCTGEPPICGANVSCQGKLGARQTGICRIAAEGRRVDSSECFARPLYRG